MNLISPAYTIPFIITQEQINAGTISGESLPLP